MSKVESNTVQTPAAPTRATIPHPKQRRGKPGGDVSESFDNREEGGSDLKVGSKWRYFKFKNIRWWKAMSVNDFENILVFLPLFQGSGRLGDDGEEDAMPLLAGQPPFLWQDWASIWISFISHQEFLYLDPFGYLVPWLFLPLEKTQGFWAHRLYGPPLVCKVFFGDSFGAPKNLSSSMARVLANLEAQQRSSRSKRILFPWPDSDEFVVHQCHVFVLSTNFQYMDDILC